MAGKQRPRTLSTGCASLPQLTRCQALCGPLLPGQLLRAALCSRAAHVGPADVALEASCSCQGVREWPLLLRSLLVSGERAHIPEPLPEAERAGACRTAPAHCKHFLYRWGPCGTEDRWRDTGHTVTEAEPGLTAPRWRLQDGRRRREGVADQTPKTSQGSSIARDRLKWSVWGREGGGRRGRGERESGGGAERERQRQRECV